MRPPAESGGFDSSWPGVRGGDKGYVSRVGSSRISRGPCPVIQNVGDVGLLTTLLTPVPRLRPKG